MHFQTATRNSQQIKPETEITTEYYYIGGPMGNIAVYQALSGIKPSRMITMQTIYNDGGFSSMGISNKLIDQYIDCGCGE